MFAVHTPAILRVHGGKGVGKVKIRGLFDEIFLERLIGIGEVWLSSIKTPPKMKVPIFHYVPQSHAKAQRTQNEFGVPGFKLLKTELNAED
jgi:hypothetical protein